jgi:hypothetical protein
MAIPKELMEKMATKLQNEQLTNEFYDAVETLMQKALTQVSKENNLPINQLNFFIAGDHMLNTNLANNSPLVVFVGLRKTKDQILLNQQAKNANKRMQKYLAPNVTITDEQLAMLLFYALQANLQPTDKLFINKNIIMLNLENTIKVKLIVGYYFNQTFYYDYLGSFHQENLLKLIEAFDNKEQQTNQFYNLVRILKSMELELLELGYIKQKTFDTLYFVEHLIFNIPNTLLQKNSIYDVFIGAINYLKNANLNEFKLAGSNDPMFDNASKYSTAKAKYFIKIIELFFTNFEQIVS